MIVDASVWVSYFLPRDRFHAETVVWLEERLRNEEPMAAPALLLAEVAGAVARETGRADLGLAAVEELRNIPSVVLVSLEGDLASLSARAAATLSMRGADAVYVATAQRLATPLVTWDAEQRTRGSTLVATRSPTDFA